MHQLKNDFGCFKFILIVPSLAIKEGTKNSIQSPDWIQHFRQEFNNQNITLGLVNAGDFANKKASANKFPKLFAVFVTVPNRKAILFLCYYSMMEC